MVRKIRRIVYVAVPAIGMGLVIGAVLFGQSLAVQLFLVVAGLLMTEAGLWRLADPILPDERKYVALRAEADHFIALVRQLNTAAVSLEEGDATSSQFAMDELQTEMHRSVDRMVTFAGKTRAEVPSSEAEAEADATGQGGEPDAGMARAGT